MKKHIARILGCLMIVVFIYLLYIVPFVEFSNNKNSIDWIEYVMHFLKLTITYVFISLLIGVGMKLIDWIVDHF